MQRGCRPDFRQLPRQLVYPNWPRGQPHCRFPSRLAAIAAQTTKPKPKRPTNPASSRNTSPTQPKAQARGSSGQPEAEARGSCHQPEAQARGCSHQPEAQARGCSHQPEAVARGCCHQPQAEARGSRHQPEAQARGSSHQPKAQTRGSSSQKRGVVNPAWPRPKHVGQASSLPEPEKRPTPGRVQGRKQAPKSPPERARVIAQQRSSKNAKRSKRGRCHKPELPRRFPSGLKRQAKPKQQPAPTKQESTFTEMGSGQRVLRVRAANDPARRLRRKATPSRLERRISIAIAHTPSVRSGSNGCLPLIRTTPSALPRPGTTVANTN